MFWRRSTLHAIGASLLGLASGENQAEGGPVSFAELEPLPGGGAAPSTTTGSRSVIIELPNEEAL